MNLKDCCDQKKFNLLKAYITKYGKEIKLCERLIADKETTSIEFLFNDKYIELIEHSKIIVIDKKNEIPPYACLIENNELKIFSYESRFDTDDDINTRINDWCEIIDQLVSEE